MRTLSSPDRIAFADLVDKVFDAEFDEAFPENGKFEKHFRRGREYWYYRGYTRPPTGERGQQTLMYVGPADAPKIAQRVERFGGIRSSYRQRRELATRLRQAGLPSPSPIEGATISAMSKAGLFRMRAVLIGSLAYQTYGGLLGVKLAEAHYRTEDLDIAQFYGIARYLDDAIDVAPILQGVDPSFKPVFDPNNPELVLAYRNRSGFKIEFLTPNRGDAAFEEKLVKLPALGGVGAQPLRFLDFLIRNPVNSVLLYEAGIGVLVPTPERYAIHKLILATLRKSDGRAASKAVKDIDQANSLIEAMDRAKQSTDLGFAWVEAWDRGAKWRRRLATGALRLGDDAFRKLSAAVASAAQLDGADDPAAFGIGRGRNELISWLSAHSAFSKNRSLVGTERR
jgi:hypothetical protein